jgi:putative MATE family efflux protein
VLTDNYFLASVNQDAINGAGNAGLVYLTISMIAIGSGSAFQILIARRIGERRPELAHAALRSSMVIHLALGVTWAGVVFLSNHFGLLGALIGDPNVRAVFEPFLGIRTWGFPVFFLLLAFNSYFTGNAKTWPLLIVSGTTALLNILLDAILVGGIEGWVEPQGALGAARASLIAEVVGLTIAAWVLRKAAPELKWRGQLMTRGDLREWWKLAYPMMGQLSLTIGTWTGFFFLVEHVGGLELKVSHIARNLFMLAFVVAQGMAQTTRTYVSGLLAEGRASELRQVIRTIISFNFIGIMLLTHGFVLYPRAIAEVFFDHNLAGIEAMINTTHVIFSAVVIYSVTSILLASLQGAGETKAAFRIEFFAVVLYVIVTWAMTVWRPQPVWVIWRVEWVYFCTIGLGSWLTLRHKSWIQHSTH